MISLEGAVWTVIYLLVAAVVFGLLYFLINAIGRELPGEGAQMFVKFARILLLVLAVLVVIFMLLSLVGGKPLFRNDLRWGAITTHEVWRLHA